LEEAFDVECTDIVTGFRHSAFGVRRTAHGVWRTAKRLGWKVDGSRGWVQGQWRRLWVTPSESDESMKAQSSKLKAQSQRI